MIFENFENFFENIEKKFGKFFEKFEKKYTQNVVEGVLQAVFQLQNSKQTNPDKRIWIHKLTHTHTPPHTHTHTHTRTHTHTHAHTHTPLTVCDIRTLDINTTSPHQQLYHFYRYSRSNGYVNAFWG